WLSFRLAGAGAVEASVSYYGVNIDKHLDNAHNTPRLVHIAQKDTLCPPESQRRIGDWAQGTSTAGHVYEDTQHAFARAGGPSYDEAAAELANQRTLAFLERLSGNAGANGWNGR